MEIQEGASTQTVLKIDFLTVSFVNFDTTDQGRKWNILLIMNNSFVENLLPPDRVFYSDRKSIPFYSFYVEDIFKKRNSSFSGCYCHDNFYEWKYCHVQYTGNRNSLTV